MAGGRRLVEPRRLMRSGLGLIVLGHGGLALGAIVHGSVLRHVAGTSRAVTPAYAVANVVSVVSGLLSIAAGIVAILVSHNLSRAALHWALLSVSLLNCLLSAACSVGLALAFALTVNSRGTHLITGCNSSALPADARAAIATNDCPFNTTRIYNHRMVWVGRDLKAHPVPTPCHRQGHLPIDQVAPSPVQPGLEHCQGWGSHSFSGQPVPGPHHPHREKLLPHI
ncbi:keratinocyte-associated protein 3 isoform X2 [Pezoporus flaviventris]|uniref:keratinocyte-associated protein 3 isoform X2 n=1 Tax=Pezoporus flaviventris TaxID=889875 RepID=UPI002AAF224E|nr:keratinocyte-associated protein 3 isoform X2 [Pezoporus flaviventris]